MMARPEENRVTQQLEEVSAAKTDSARKDPDTIEREWLANVYQGDHVPQLTVRALIMGMLLGGIMSLSNLYVGLKTGWGLGVAITSSILAFAIFKSLQAAFPRLFKSHFTILENNTMSSAASAAGYMSSAGLVSAIPAMMMLTGQKLGGWQLMAFISAISFLGVVMAIPMKRQMINQEQLTFPSGIAAAETLKSMHSHGEEAMGKARSLGIFGIIGALNAWLINGRVKWMPFNIPENLFWPWKIAGLEASKLTVGLETSMIMTAAGAIMGIRVATSLLLGAIINYVVLAPMLINSGVIAEGGYRNIARWSLWPGAGMMVASGLLAFFMNWKAVVRAFSGLGAMFGKKAGGDDPLADIEVPSTWFGYGLVITGTACVLVVNQIFGIPVWEGILAVMLTFLLAIVACRATGETDITPIGAMGKITQLTYGVIAPGNMVTNLMTANVTAGAASHSADLLTDLKAGYILGGNPRKQFWAQFFGVLAGAAFVVPVYNLIVPDASVIGTDKMPAPSAQVWAGVAKLLSQGIHSLPPSAVTALYVAAGLGVALTLLEKAFPKYRAWIPSPTGLGIALVVPFFNSFSMFLGALIAWIFTKVKPEAAEKYIIPVSSGLIAGESILGIVIAYLQVRGIIQ
jgi:putative OPT family oligopeptide transporter